MEIQWTVVFPTKKNNMVYTKKDTNVQLSYMTMKNQTLKNATSFVLLTVKETKPTGATKNVFLSTDHATENVEVRVCWYCPVRLG